MAEIDSLEIKIASDVTKANNAINSLIRNLGRLSNSLKIDTSGLEKIGKSLNLSGIDKSTKSMQSQTQKVSKSLSQIIEQYKDLGKGFEIKGSTQQIQKQIDSLTNQLAKAKLAKEDFEASGKTNLGGYETAVKNVIKYTNQIESLKRQIASMQNEQPKIDIDTSGLEQRKKYIIEYKKELLDFKKDMQNISDAFGGLQNIPKGMFDIPMENLKISIQELKRDYPQATEVITAFEKELLRLQEISSKLTREPTRPKIDASSFDETNKRIAELVQRFSNLGTNFKFKGNFEQLNIEIEKMKSKLQELGEKEKEMLSSGKINTEDFEKLQAAIMETGNKLDIMKGLSARTEEFRNQLKQLQVPPIHEENLTKLQNALRKTEEDTEKLRTKLANGLTMGNIVPNIDDRQFRRLTEQIALSEKQAEALRQKIQEVGVGANGADGKLDKFKGALSRVFGQSNKTSSATNALQKNIKNLSSAMNGFNKSAGKAITGMKSFARQALAAMGVYLGVYGAVRGLKNAIESSMNYVETLNYFNAAFGQVAENADLSSFKKMGYDSADAYYNSFSERAEQLTQKMTGFKVGEGGRLENARISNLGIDPNQLMNYQATFAQMSSSMGVSSETALQLSNALTMIGADLASVKNMDFNKVWNDMASGLAGMSRTLDKYGVNIRNANLQQELNNLGLNANITALNQSDKALLRTTILLNNTTFAWGDMARTIEQPANQMRLLKSNLSNLSRTIGNIFLPIVAKALPYINGFVIALQRLAEQLVKLLGFEDFDWGGIGSSNFDMSSLYDEADAFDEVAEKAKKASDNLQGFDKINKLSDDESGKDGTSGSQVTGALNDAFLNALSEYQKKWDEAFSNMDSKAQKVANNIEKAFKTLFKRIEAGDFEGLGKDISEALTKQLKKINWKKIYNGAKNFGSGLAKFLNGLIKPKLFKRVAKTIAGSLNTALHFLNSFGTTFDWKNFGNSIAQGINEFFKTFDFWLFAQTINTWIKGALTTASTLLKNTDFKQIGEKIGLFLKTIDFTEISKQLANTIWQAIKAAFNLLSGLFKEAPLETSLILAFSAMKFTKLGAAFATQISTSLKTAFASSKIINSISLAITEMLGKSIAGISVSALLKSSAGLGTFFYVLFSNPEQLGGDLEKPLYELRDAVEESIGSATSTIEQFNKSSSEIGGNYEQIKKITEQYYDLSLNYNGLTSEQKSLLKSYADILKENVKGVEEFIDPITGAYKGTKKELDKLIKRTEEYYVKIAAEDATKETIKNTIDLKMKYSELNGELDKLKTKDFTNWMENLKQRSPELSNFVSSLQQANYNYDDLTDAYKEQYDELYKTNEVFKMYMDSLGDVPKNLGEVSKSLEKSETRMDTLNKIVASGGKNWKKYIEEESKMKDAEGQLKASTSKMDNSITSFVKNTKANMVDMSKSGSTSAQDLKKNFSNGLVGLGITLPGKLSGIKTNFSSTASSVGTSGGSRLVNAFGLQTNLMTNKAMIGIGNLQKDKNLLTKANTVGGNLGKEVGNGVSEGLTEKASKILSSFKNIFKDFKFELNTDTVKKGAKLAFKLAFPNLKGFATGGYPDFSSPFVVGENGPEIMGGMYGKPAVANNSSITEGIEEAAYRGMIRALAESGRNGNTNVTVTLTGDSKKMFSVIQKEARQYKAQTGMGAFPV